MFNGNLDETNFENTRNEWRKPEWMAIFQTQNFMPLVVYFFIFRTIAHLVRITMWKKIQGFRQYRLRNLTVCLIHSLISGGFVLIFAIINPYAMFVEPMHWYQPWTRHVLLFSMSYFLHDVFDMLNYEISRFTIELLLHHFCSAFAFLITVCSRKFVVFAFLALLMEINSVWLHIRTLMQLSGNSVKHPIIYKTVQYINLITFITTRFGIQGWQARYIWQHRDKMHMIYFGIGILGCSFFLIINAFLLVRILAADGYLGEFGRKHAAINRDNVSKQRSQKSE